VTFVTRPRRDNLFNLGLELQMTAGQVAIATRGVESRDDEEWCATLMSTSEPWITLGRDYNAALAVVRDPSGEIYLAELDGERVGFVILALSGLLNGYIRSIAVAATHRDRGIGAQIMRFAESRIFEGSPNAFLCVTSFNERARAFYERLGYRYVGELTNFFVPGVSELLYRKTLGSWSEFRAEREQRTAEE
jgi:ribosomal protein S18 acetylase RimI-like enzyme